MTPAEIALAWLAGLSSIVIPLPGPTRVETAKSAARALSVTLTPEDRERDNTMTVDRVEGAFARMQELLGLRSRSRTARTPPVRLFAGAGSRCQASA